MENLILPKPAYNVLRRLTGESRPDVALSLALKELVQFRLKAAKLKIRSFEKKYERISIAYFISRKNKAILSILFIPSK